MKSRFFDSLIVLGALLAVAAGAMAQDYDRKGKRDPFVNPLQANQKLAPRILPPPPFAQRPPGLSGLLISEVTVVGTAASDVRRIAILRGTDKFTYIAREGTRLFDGFLETITSDEVTFIREVFDTAGNKTTSKVLKRYYTEAN